jgi:hypothetical protein
VWKEYAQNTAEANKKFKGKFVQVSGRLAVVKTDKTTQLSFDPPESDAKWRLLFSLKDARDLKDGQEIIVRGRFQQRKDQPESPLLMSNCSLVTK